MNDRRRTETSQRTGVSPCPYCGHLMPVGAGRCDRCRLALDERTRRSLRKVMGPWFVLEPEVPSAPGVNWMKLLSLIRRGRVGPECILRGPATGMLWRFARDTPGVATQLGLCWSCHAALADTSAEHCPGCGADVNGPVDWAVEPDESPDESGSPEAAEELVLLEGTPAGSLPSPPGAAPGRGGGTPLPASGRPLALMIVLVGAAVCVGTFWSVFEIVRRQRDRAEPAGAVAPGEPASPRREGGGAPRFPAEAPAGALPGELFPRVPFESPTTRPGPPEATTAPAHADGLSPEQLTAQRLRGQTLLAEARRLHAAGDLLGAQALLLELLNRLDARAWPEGAEQELRRIQAALAAAATSAPGFFDTERE